MRICYARTGNSVEVYSSPPGEGEKEPRQCPIFSLNFSPKKSPRACSARRPTICGSSSPNALVERGPDLRGRQAFATPRRLALAGARPAGAPARCARGEKGPARRRAGGRDPGLSQERRPSSIGEAKIQKDKKGEFYVAVIESRAAPTIDVLAEILPECHQELPLAEIHALGRGLERPGELRWVRPLHSIVATFGPETEEPDIVPFAVDGIAAGDVTRGHRFLAPAPFAVRRFEDYMHGAGKAPRSCSTPERRRDIILTDAKNLAFAQGLELVEDEGLLDEVAGLVEWPVVLMGAFDESFLAIPPEVIRATIRVNQKCFVLRDAATPSWPTASSSSPTSRRATAARRSSPATSASSARGCPTPSSSTRPI